MRRVRTSRISNFTAGVIVLVLAVIGTYLGFSKSIPFEHHYTLKAVFASSNNIRKNSPVRIAGVNVGKITSVEHVAGSQAAIVTMRIDNKGLPIHKDARIRIRPRIFLEGNFFADLQPGSPSAPVVSDGDTLPINQTSTPVQLDQVLTALQADTRHDLQRLLGAVGTGLSGKGARGYNRSIPYWKPAYQDGSEVADASRGILEHDLSGYVANAGRTAEALDRNSVQLQSLITDFNATAGAFAARNQQLASAVGELPRTLRAAMPALAALNRAFPPVRRLARALRPGVRSSGPAIDATLPLARQLRGLVSKPELRGLVADLGPVVPQLANLNKETVPLFQQTGAASRCQNEVVLPWSKDTLQDPVFPATGPVYKDSVKVLPGLAGESRTGDANGQWFRVLLSGGLYAYPLPGGRFMLTGQPLEGANPPAAPQPPLRPDVPCETQQPPDLRSYPQGVSGEIRAQIPADRQADFRALVAKTVSQVRGLIKVDGLSKVLRVSSEPAGTNVLDELRALKDKAMSTSIRAAKP
jgi:ABC-type transporter Mla subunit MlaD